MKIKIVKQVAIGNNGKEMKFDVGEEPVLQEEIAKLLVEIGAAEILPSIKIKDRQHKVGLKVK